VHVKEYTYVQNLVEKGTWLQNSDYSGDDLCLYTYMCICTRCTTDIPRYFIGLV